MSGYILCFDKGEVELYRPDAKSKMKPTELKKEWATYSKTAVLVQGDVFVSADDFSSELGIFDTKKNAFVARTDQLPTDLRAHTITEMDDRVYICGGIDQDGETTAMCLYLDNDGKWYSTPEMNHRRAYSCCASMDGQLFVFGGQGADCAKLSSVEVLDPYDNEFVLCASMKKRRVHAACATVGRYVYVCGGRMDNSSATSSCEMYHPKSDKWLPMASMSVGRAGHQCVVLNDTLYAIGGVDTYDDVLDSVECYDPDHDEWMLCSQPLKSPRSFFGAVAVHGKPPSSGSCSIL